MALNEDEIVSKAMAQMDAAFIIKQLGLADGPQKEQMANDIAAAVWDMQRSRALSDAKQFVNTRYLLNGEEVTVDGDGTTVGLTGGKGQFDIVNFEGGTASIDSATNARQLNVRVGGGGADCMFDYLVSQCWADEVAAGRGVEGQTMTSLTGCTFKVYSTITGAMTDIDTKTSNDSSTVFICSGTYDESFTVPTVNSSSLHIIGSGEQNTVIRPTSGSTVVTLAASVSGIMTFYGMTIDSSGISGTPDAIDASSAFSLHITRCWIITGSGDTGIFCGDATTGADISQCHFTGSGTGIRSGSGTTSKIRASLCYFAATLAIGIDWTGATTFGECSTNEFFSDIGIRIGNGASGFSITNNLFNNCIDGIYVYSNSTREVAIGNNTFYQCTDGIDLSTVNVLNSATMFTIEGNNFFTTSATDVGIRGHATRFYEAAILGNTFGGYTAPNEVVDCTGIRVQVAHNVTNSGTPIIDSGLGHSGSGTGQAASNAEPFVTYGPSPTLPNARQYINVGAGTPPPSSLSPDGGFYYDATANALYLNDLSALTWRVPQAWTSYISLGEVPVDGKTF